MTAARRPARRRGSLAAALLAGVALTGCRPEPVDAPDFLHSVLRPVDYGVIVVYLCVVILLGWWVGRGQRSTEDFFLAGRAMHWFPVGLSIMATLFSAITYLGYPGEIYQYGAPILAGLLTFALVAPVVMLLFMPFYHRLRLTTAYEYLEHRFDLRVRSFASGLFVLCRIGWLAAVVYTPSLALSVVTGWDLRGIIIVCGAVATLYTILGGMKAVIWTDVVQFFAFAGGIAGALVILHYALDGGFADAFHVARVWDQTHPDAFRLRLNWDWRPTARMTVWALWIGNFITLCSDYGADQVSVQRYLTTPSLAAMRRSFLLNLVGVYTVVCGLALVGLGLWAYYQQSPDPRLAQVKSDQVFPYFVAVHFPTGLAGLTIAALLAATMSSIDSGLNSVATALMVDFCERRGWVGADEAARLRLARRVTLALGVAVTALALEVGRLGNIIEITNKVNNAPKGPLLAIFVLGMLTVRARPSAVLAAACVGLVAGLYTTFWWPEASRPNFLWISLVGFAVTTVLGYGLSLSERGARRQETPSPEPCPPGERPP